MRSKLYSGKMIPVSPAPHGSSKETNASPADRGTVPSFGQPKKRMEEKRCEKEFALE